MKYLIAALFAAAFCIGVCASPVESKVRPIFCIDGDTFMAAPDSRVYRLWGVDAPELDQRWGEVAKHTLIELIHRKQAHIEVKGYSYKRPVVRVTVRQKDIGLELIKMGLAWWEPKFAPDREDYKEAEEEARKAKRGLWSDSKPVRPSEHRAARKNKESVDDDD